MTGQRTASITSVSGAASPRANEQDIIRGDSIASDEGSAARQRIRAEAPAIFRLDDNYTQADNARILNRFGRDTVQAFQVIGEVVGPLVEQQAALDAALAGSDLDNIDLTDIVLAIADLNTRLSALEGSFGLQTVDTPPLNLRVLQPNVGATVTMNAYEVLQLGPNQYVMHGYVEVNWGAGGTNWEVRFDSPFTVTTPQEGVANEWLANTQNDQALRAAIFTNQDVFLYAEKSNVVTDVRISFVIPFYAP